MFDPQVVFYVALVFVIMFVALSVTVIFALIDLVMALERIATALEEHGPLEARLRQIKTLIEWSANFLERRKNDLL